VRGQKITKIIGSTCSLLSTSPFCSIYPFSFLPFLSSPVCIFFFLRGQWPSAGGMGCNQETSRPSGPFSQLAHSCQPLLLSGLEILHHGPSLPHHQRAFSEPGRTLRGSKPTTRQKINAARSVLAITCRTKYRHHQLPGQNASASKQLTPTVTRRKKLQLQAQSTIATTQRNERIKNSSRESSWATSSQSPLLFVGRKKEESPRIC
jgi:hypothetical protein